ncbi:pirin family protein [Aliamphritea hakodatensis]|uniref:pirin family protein n=1 Tax=Aliamphritea hakodatensis TaxID=2895352 RepID=UPI0022FD3BBC|nr:pirin family protein [Aliamphritea hakodatensis]
MIRIRRSDDRGFAHYGWLESRYCFSFASYFDPDFMGLANLRACNEDSLHPGASIDPCQFQQTEVFSLILEGQAQFHDSLGRKGTFKSPGGALLLSAADEIDFNLTNNGAGKTLRMLQLWLTPTKSAPLEANLQQARLSPSNGILLVASPDGRDHSMALQQNICIYKLKLGKTACGLPAEKYGFLQLLKGELEINGSQMAQGDAALISDEAMLSVRTGPRTEALYVTMGEE